MQTPPPPGGPNQPPPPPGQPPYYGAPYGQPYGQPYPMVVMQRPEASGSTASMVLGIISLVLLPFGCCCGISEIVTLPMGIVAIVLGWQARSKASASRGALGGEGRALAGLITGAISVAFAIVILLIFVLWFGFTALLTPNTNFSIPSPTPSG